MKISKLFTCGEIEVRNDSEVHYRELKFWLHKKHTLSLLLQFITEKQPYNKEPRIILMGNAIKSFNKRKPVI